jgi:hypothetical protein
VKLLKNSSGQAKTQIVDRRIRDLGIQSASIKVPRALFQQPQLISGSAAIEIFEDVTSDLVIPNRVPGTLEICGFSLILSVCYLEGVTDH